jgi:predicted nucleic acid-binding protein
VKIFFDTSVLIALFYDDQVHHIESTNALETLDGQPGFCGAHSLLETYSVLTRMPGVLRVSTERATEFIFDLGRQFRIIALEESEYWALLQEHASSGLTGGAIYDALLARCALKGGVDVLLTWNLRHFSRLGTEIAVLAQTPTEFLRKAHGSR